MNGVEYATMNLKEALGLLGLCGGGMDDAQYNWKPGGTANTAAKSHVHALTSVDFFVNGLVGGKGMQGLLWGPFAAKHGLPENPMTIWGHDGPIPVAAMQEFAAQVEAAAVEQLSKLTDADLDREIETQFFGKKTAAWLVSLASVHAVGHGGDIAAVKGLQGLKGLPF